VIRDRADEGWNSKIGEDAARECFKSNAFNVIAKTNSSSERIVESQIVNPLD